jgi:hypothetical protein
MNENCGTFTMKATLNLKPYTYVATLINLNPNSLKPIGFLGL